MRKDILLKLYEHGELNQSKLMSYCGLNNVKHKEIIDDMVEKGLLAKIETPWGNKTIVKYNIATRGKEILKAILEPYEELFPRSDTQDT